MLGRVIAMGIIAFWLVMMTLLVRSELLQTTPLAYAVPVETVMQKIFEGEEASELAIFYQGDRVGRCSMQVVKDKKSPVPRYLVKSELLLNFQVFGRPVRMQSDTDSEFDRRYQMTRFESRTVTGDSRIEMKGDWKSREIEFVLQFGDGYQEKHKLPFETMEKMGPSGAMGLMGMGGLQLPGSAGTKTGNPSLPGLAEGGKGPTTTVEEIPLKLGRQTVHALMVHTRYDESLWSKVYVSPVGEILKVETAFGVTMRNAQLAGDDKD